MPRIKGKTNEDYERERLERQAAEREAELRRKSADEVGEAQRRQDQQAVIADRQRAECVAMRNKIKKMMRSELDPAGLGQCVRALKVLHDLERVAYDFNRGTASTGKIIAVPMRADSMETWEQQSSKVMGKREDTPPPSRKAPDAS